MGSEVGVRFPLGRGYSQNGRLDFYPGPGQREGKYGMGMEGFVLDPSVCRVSPTMLAGGGIYPFFFASTQLLFAGGWRLR